MTRVVLAIDTATVTASAALWRDGVVLATAAQDSSGHSSELLPMIDGLCRGQGILPTQLTAVAIGLGPGSFTGLRIGMATAKGVAFAAQLEMWGVSSLAAVALQMADALPEAQLATTLLVPMLDARRNEVYVGAYRSVAPDRVVAVVAETVLAPTGVAAYIDGARGSLAEVVLAGDGLTVFAEVLGALPFAKQPVQTPCASAVARLAASGEHLNMLDHGTPVYIRPSEAEVNYPNGVPGAIRKPS
ncbi:MAG: tRNA (adenosine(37)-N6)-threonylcarbamoyltransferase complex dimerization subunit type 1 TsaB [Kofleriaceae bacterium]|nr:tRNA (adenosine(37)-N6)-threonylcarbamoyltransferase complex dimerization subunit type 1 TsaB [Kofleriaceae bacterium]